MSGPPGTVPEHSDFWYRMFVIYLRGYFRRSFHAVRTSGDGSPPRDDKPLIVYSNHPSWWDPIHFALLASARLPERRLYGPMDAEALEKYAFFKKLGVFGVERSAGGPATARQRRAIRSFLRTSQAILARQGASLWLTAEGEFTDPRKRPVRIQPGVAHLVKRSKIGWVVPLAIEYPFWNERLPEALSRFGDPIEIESEPAHSTREWTRLLEQRLEDTMDALASNAGSRDPRRFETVLAGRVGIGGVYDPWRRLKAWFRGESFSPAHGHGADGDATLPEPGRDLEAGPQKAGHWQAIEDGRP